MIVQLCSYRENKIILDLNECKNYAKIVIYIKFYLFK
jgi:hypothetical protein